jgi:hypothetical protein
MAAPFLVGRLNLLPHFYLRGFMRGITDAPAEAEAEDSGPTTNYPIGESDEVHDQRLAEESIDLRSNHVSA